MTEWFELSDPSGIASPALLVYRDRVEANINRAIGIAGSAARLRPHVKTHKSADVIRLHVERGVTRFKCATLAEAEMLADSGATDILLAYQPVGPAIERFMALVKTRRDLRIACIVDDPAIVDVLDVFAERVGAPARVLIDLDVGMGRTGIASGESADELYGRIAASRWIEEGGIHAYDGHSTDSDPGVRARQAAEARERALSMRDRMVDRDFAVPEVIVSGSPPFAIHAADAPGDITLSPGTYVYHDWGYASLYPDLPFEAAALILGRVISRSDDGRFTIDVGSKAIAADPPQPRATLLSHPDAKPGRQSEEHWEWHLADPPPVGAVVYLWPRHICPSVAHYDHALVVDDSNRVADRWAITRTR